MGFSTLTLGLAATTRTLVEDSSTNPPRQARVLLTDDPAHPYKLVYEDNREEVLLGRTRGQWSPYPNQENKKDEVF